MYVDPENINFQTFKLENVIKFQSKTFADPPDPISSEPICVDSGRNHISLTWGKSHRINSAPVLAYKVEAWLIGIDGGARWQELGVTPINSFDAFNLRSGCEYHFRGNFHTTIK